jgi:MFS family permease
MITTACAQTIVNRAFISIFFTNLAMNFGQSMSNTLLAKYADFLGAPATLVGLLMSLFTITSLLFKIISAPAMDTYNKKNLVLLANCILAASFFGFSASKTVHWLMVFRLLQGAGRLFPTSAAWRWSPKQSQRKSMRPASEFFSLAQVAAQALGPTVGLWLVGCTATAPRTLSAGS